jgi:hypothetical protein
MNAVTSVGLSRAPWKKTEADLRISFARRNSQFSRRSRLSSSRSELDVSSGRAPLSASA